MPNIYPFKGWRYNYDIVDDLAKVITPPYDVINKQDQSSLYDLSPYNFIRIILNKYPVPDKYIDSARILSEWKENEVFKQDHEKSIYLLSQSFRDDGIKKNRIGFIAKLQITELGDKILPHEQTISKHINDRYELMKSTEVNTGQIFMSYRDKEKVVEAIAKTYKDKQPIIDFEIDDVQYKIWRISDTNEISRIKEMMMYKKAIIADGHHRYKTAFQYSQDHPKKIGSDQVMVTFVNAHNEGMNVFPTHRIINDKGIKEDKLINRISHLFNIEKVSSASDLLIKMEQFQSLNIINIGMISSSKNCYILCYNGEKNWSNKLSESSESLDVNILHSLILKPACGIDTNNQKHLKHLSYIRGNESPIELIKKVDDFDFIFLVNAPKLDHIFDVAEAGETMPQKSTYFFPKVYSGLIFASIGDR